MTEKLTQSVAFADNMFCFNAKPFRASAVDLLDIESQNKSEIAVSEKRHVEMKNPRAKSRVQFTQAKRKATTQSWADVVKSKPRKSPKGGLAPIIKR
jgi:hypothetical protein